MTKHRYKFAVTAVLLTALVTGCSADRAQPVADDSPAEITDQQDKSQASENTEKVSSSGKEETSGKDQKTKSVGDFDITMKSASTLNVSGPFTPETGNVYVITVFEVKNNSDQPVEISSGSHFAAKADGADVYQAWMVEPEGINWIDGQAEPGQTVEGCVCFEVPENFNELKVEFYPDIMEKDSVTFTVTH